MVEKIEEKIKMDGNSHQNGISFYLNGVELKVFYRDGELSIKKLTYKYSKKKIQKFIKLSFFSSLVVTFNFIASICYPNCRWLIEMAIPIIVFINGIFMRFTEVSKYHGAEHKIINTINSDKQLVISEVIKASRIANNRII